jgi:non-heme chloroperoxidase
VLLEAGFGNPAHYQIEAGCRPIGTPLYRKWGARAHLQCDAHERIPGSTERSPPLTTGSSAHEHIHHQGGVELYYKDWGSGQPIVFCHGWPLNADSWESQMIFLAGHGYRCIAHDRRGHGRSSEVARYIGRHGTKRVAKASLVSAVPPLMLKTDANPGGLPMEVFDGIRAAQVANRSQLYLDLPSGPFYGFNRPGAAVSQGLVQAWWMQGMMGGHKNTFDSIKAFSETDFTEDLKQFTIPTLIIHGDDDQVVPIDAAGRASKTLVPHATLIVYPGAPHGLTETHKDQVNADLLAFIRE